MNLQRREEISALLAAPVTGGAGQVLEYRDALMECRAHIDTLEQTAAERVIARGAVVKPHTFGEIVNQVRDIASQYAGTEQLRERIAYVLAPHFERNGGPTPDYTGEGSAWVPPVEHHPIGAADSVYFRRELESLIQRLPSADGPWLARYLLKLARVADSTTVDCAPEDTRAVVVPDDTFTLDLDEFGEKLACITINSKNRGTGYELCGTMGDGHFSRRTFDITPYLAHCLNTIGVRAIPAGRVMGEGMVAVDREELELLRRCEKHLRSCKAVYDLSDRGKFAALDALRANQGGAAT